MGFNKNSKDKYDLSIKEKIRFELLKLKSIKGFKNKFEYIYDYYKWWFVGILVFGILIYALVDAQIQNSKEDIIYVAAINSGLVSSSESAIIDDFAQLMQMNPKKQTATLDVSYSMDSEMSTEYSYSSSMKLYAQFASRDIDIVIADKDMFDFYCKNDAFYHLDEILPKEFLKEHADNLIMGTDEEGNEYLMGLNLSDCERAKELMYASTPILSIVSNTENLERAIMFVQFLYMD